MSAQQGYWHAQNATIIAAISPDPGGPSVDDTCCLSPLTIGQSPGAGVVSKVLFAVGEARLLPWHHSRLAKVARARALHQTTRKLLLGISYAL